MSAELETLIERKTTGSLIYVLLGLLGPVGLPLGALAFYRGRQAVSMIDERHVGEQYRGRARAAWILGGIEFGFWLLVLLGVLLLAALGRS